MSNEWLVFEDDYDGVYYLPFAIHRLVLNTRQQGCIISIDVLDDYFDRIHGDLYVIGVFTDGINNQRYTIAIKHPDSDTQRTILKRFGRV